jgi:signal transduction histidine kinase
MLDDLGLVPTVRWYVQRYAERSNISVQFELPEFEQRLDTNIETALYRVLQEAFTNVARHAQATEILLRLDRTPSEVVAYVEDNGIGFDVATIMDVEKNQAGAGLLGMRERVTLLGGTLTISSEPGAGTQLYLAVPLGETE